MAKKHAFPTKSCPNCQQPIHARSKKHEACGWGMDGSAAPAVPSNGRRRGRARIARKAKSGSQISLADIEAVKAVVDRVGAAKVQQLAALLAK